MINTNNRPKCFNLTLSFSGFSFSWKEKEMKKKEDRKEERGKERGKEEREERKRSRKLSVQ